MLGYKQKWKWGLLPSLSAAPCHLVLEDTLQSIKSQSPVSKGWLKKVLHYPLYIYISSISPLLFQPQQKPPTYKRMQRDL